MGMPLYGGAYNKEGHYEYEIVAGHHQKWLK